MIIDTSALVAILAEEDDAAVYASAIVATATRTISAANYLECAIVFDNRLNPLSGRGFDQFLLESGIAITSVTPELGRIARMAYRDFGHVWRAMTARFDKEHHSFARDQRCQRCKTNRSQTVGIDGSIDGNQYKYPEGYKAPEGSGRWDKDARATLRLASTLRMIKED